MCNISGIIFGTSNLFRQEVAGKRVLEVGAKDVNGSLRRYIESLGPGKYVGVDIEKGKGVDLLCEAGKLHEKFGSDSFDLVIATELLEHVRDWRGAISNIKKVCKPGGIMLVTTRSRGFQYHAWPDDFWRFEQEDMEKIFSDCRIIVLEKDRQEPGIFLKAQKPADFRENDLSGLELFSIVTGKKQKIISKDDESTMRYFYLSGKARVVEFLIRSARGFLK